MSDGMRMDTRVWLDGRIVGPDQARVAALDHGLTVGDGVFETVKVVRGVPFALTRHLRRLAASAAGLGLPAPDEDLVRGAVAALLAEPGRPDPARLRVTCTGGPSPLGSERGDGPPTLWVALGPLPAPAAAASVAVVPWTRNERGATAGLKTTSYAENVVALAHARRRGATEAVFANTVGQLCEGTGSNVFLGHEGRLVTPSLASGCLAGVTRGLLLEWTDAVEVDLPVAALAAAPEAFLASTTRDVQPIQVVDGVPLPVAPGPLTQAAAAAFARRSAAAPDP